MLQAFYVVLLAFFDICRLKKRPQDIPASRNLLTICILVYSIVSIFIAALYQPTEQAILGSVIELVLILLFTWAILQSSGKAVRWTQTVTALIGTNMIINIIALPAYVLVSVDELSDLGTSSSSSQSLGLLLLAALACWNIVIMAHIIRHALETHFAIAMFLAITYIWIIFSFTSAVMPAGVS
jgi:hypothetical protein